MKTTSWLHMKSRVLSSRCVTGQKISCDAKFKLLILSLKYLGMQTTRFENHWILENLIS
jgi:hypothetical protein